ncbi:MAG: 3-phosphoshikimate 1-carboxyvinyltransferase [Paramuribaculum sp.]|nr:3-phosphoshikimate 1-carboxyvinyltransferase [Paramuribaculum sp.]
MNYRIFPPEELMDVEIILPLSKSISNRALIINALTSGTSPLENVAKCDDTDAMIEALTGNSREVNIGAAGTAMRFLTAYFAVQTGVETELTGSERMCNRPIAPLVDALKSVGADISYIDKEGFPPLRIKGKNLTGGTLSIDAGVSSQYISALMMIAPVLESGLRITLEGEIISMPYIRMTAYIMERFGVHAEIEGNIITIAHGSYSAPADFKVEGDWSAASYWFEIQALTCGWTALRGLHEKSCQGDSAIVDSFRELGVETGFETDPLRASLEASPDLTPRFAAELSSTPDVAQTFAVTCAMLGVPFRLSGLRSLRIKETDRIAALTRELLKVGVVLDTEGDEAISWDGIRRPLAGIPVFDTYDDHRMAMCLAPVAVFIPGIVIRDAEVVSKSYPGYWDDLRKAGFTIEEVEEEAAE